MNQGIARFYRIKPYEYEGEVYDAIQLSSDGSAWLGYLEPFVDGSPIIKLHNVNAIPAPPNWRELIIEELE